MERRVVITGLGAITPIGKNVAETWKGIENKTCGINEISLFDASTFKTKFDAEVKDYDPLVYFEPKEAKRFNNDKRGLVEFKDVTFKYPGAHEAVLENISFIAKPGQTTAFIGSTGSGKSTLINLIPRFYEVSEGSIMVDGVDIRDVKQHDLRDKIGLVPQKGLLFSGTIRSNLTYGAPDATDEQLEEVIKVAQAKEFIDHKEEHLEKDDKIS